jgi:bifunctional non-homologous end joining protein LigD
LRGRFVLVRRDSDEDGEPWMLLHKHDSHAREGWDPEVRM